MKTYYNDTPRKVAFENTSISVSDAKDYFKVLSDHIQSYIGFLDMYDDLIIFKWFSENKWLVEHLVVPGTLHRQRYATTEECLIFIENVYNESDISGFQGFEEVPIGEFTLDEILEFKEEDTYLLREEEPPAKKVIAPQSKVSQPKKTTKPSRILGDISVPKEKPRAKSTSSGITGKKPKTTTSPLKQFKASAAELKKEKKQPKTTKTPVKQVAKKANPPKSIPAKTDSTSLLNLEKTIEPKKVELTKASKTSKKKTKPQQTTTSKTNPKAPEQQPTIKPKKSKGKTLQTLGEPIAEKKKVAPKKSKPFNQQTSKKDTTKPNDDGFFSI